MHKLTLKTSSILAVEGIIMVIFHWAGALLIAGAAAWWFLQKNTYSVVLSSASGNQDALTDKDADFIQRAVSALNDAIVYRG